MAKKKLTPRQARFVEEYLIDLNATKAAERAGYSKKTAEVQGSRLLRNAKVSEAVKAEQEKRSERTEITQDYVLGVIVETVDRCRQGVPVLDALGQPIIIETQAGDLAPAWKFSPKEVLRGCELLGKHLGLYVERHEHKHEIPEEVRQSADDFVGTISRLASRGPKNKAR